MVAMMTLVFWLLLLRVLSKCHVLYHSVRWVFDGRLREIRLHGLREKSWSCVGRGFQRSALGTYKLLLSALAAEHGS